jgi:PAS domain S-box-containing protein
VPLGAAVGFDIFEQMEEGVSLCDTSGRFLYLNPTAERLLGQRREAFLGCVWWEVLPELSSQPVHRAFERVAEGGAPESMEFLLKPRGRWLRLRFFRVPEGICAIAHDITARKQAEAEANAVVDTLQEAVVVHDGRGRVVKANASAESLLGLGREGLAGRDTQDARRSRTW